MLCRKFLERSFSNGVNPLKSVLRFENQNLTWSWKDTEAHTDSFAQGLLELGFKEGDRLATWFDRSHVSETVACQLGALKAGVVLCPVQEDSEAGVAVALQNSRGLICSPNGRVKDQKKSEILQNMLPETHRLQNGLPLNSSAFPSLKVLIQTGFYSIPGFMKYKDLLVYSQSNFSTHGFTSTQSGNIFNNLTVQETMETSQAFLTENSLTPEDTLVVLAEAINSDVFAKAALLSYNTGCYSIYCGTAQNVDTVLSNVKSAVVLGDSSSKMSYTGDNIRQYYEL